MHTKKWKAWPIVLSNLNILGTIHYNAYTNEATKTSPNIVRLYNEVNENKFV